jgi:hypothetical protein
LGGNRLEMRSGGKTIINREYYVIITTNQDNIMYNAIVERTIQKSPYGWIIKIIYKGWLLLFIITLFLCLGNFRQQDFDFHKNESNHNISVREPVNASYAEITITATPNYINN